MSGRETTTRGLRRLERIATWQLLLVLVVMAFVAATFLRLNNIGMVQRREAVLSADEQGNTEALHNRLYDLQRYTTTHMNSDTGAIYLQESYNRAAQAAKEAAEASTTNGENIYKKIEDEVCGPLARANGWRWPNPQYIACQQAELAKYPEAVAPASTVALPNTELYRHSYASPIWSPDFAGFSVLLCLVLIGVIIARLISLGVLRIFLKHYYKSD